MITHLTKVLSQAECKLKTHYFKSLYFFLFLVSQNIGRPPVRADHALCQQNHPGPGRSIAVYVS